MAGGAASPNARPYLDPRALLSDEAKDRLQDADDVQFVLDHIARDPSDIPQEKDLGKLVSGSLRTFRRNFCRVVGRSYRQFVKEYSIVLALLMLSIHDLTVEECTDRLGRSSRGSLRRLFRPEFGRPPSTFRKEQQPVSKRTLERIIERIVAGRPFREIL